MEFLLSSGYPIPIVDLVIQNCFQYTNKVNGLANHNQHEAKHCDLRTDKLGASLDPDYLSRGPVEPGVKRN
jgi:hypothetical protein